jgi:uncharacterized protein (DUF2147 family)
MFTSSKSSASVRIAGLVAVVGLGLAVAATRGAAAADDKAKAVLGYWKHVDDSSGKTQSIFRLWEDKGKLFGKIVKTFPVPGKKQQEVCTECSGAQKDKPVPGLIFMWGFSKDSAKPTKWVEGKILNPEDGKVYNAEVDLDEDGKTLNVYGYIKVLVKLGGTSKWQRPTAEELQGIQ